MLKRRVTVAVIVLSAVSPFAYASTVTYNINFRVGAVSITGTITTDGTQGALTQSSLLSYNLKYYDSRDSYTYASNSTKEPGFWCGKLGCGMTAESTSLVASKGSVNFGKPTASSDHMTFQYRGFGKRNPKLQYTVTASPFYTRRNQQDKGIDYESKPFVLGTAP